MKESKLFKVSAIALLLGTFALPLAGCGGVESEPIGVDEPDPEMEAMESEEYIEGEQ